MRKGFTLIELMIVIAIIAIIAAIAIPNLLESRVTANEAAASASLKAGVFASQVQFMGGGYLDRDLDNVGEAGTLRMLAGIAPVTRAASAELRFLTGPLASQANYGGGAGVIAAPAYGEASGFRFAAYAASLTNSDEETTEMLFETNGLVVPVPAVAPATANNGERQWIVGCVPSSWGDTGRRVFVLGADGQIRSPADPLVVAQIYSGAPSNGAQGTAAILGFTIGTNLDKTQNPTLVPKPVPVQTAPAVDMLDSDDTADNPAPQSHFPVFAK